ncbi:MAG: tRNA pseudouridine(55) synthase TruB [Schwartzia sp. (in: firmicutes)]
MKDGFLNVLKPPGMTSHDVVGFVRRTLDVKKAGHAGTLDPGAAGVLPVAVGRATRLLEYLHSVDKSYRAELRFGMATDSDDDLGSVVEARWDFVMPEGAAIASAVRSLTGKIRQRPPLYSAVKIGGRRACDLARTHHPVTLAAREVEIYRLEVAGQGEDTLLLDVDCSKGTYIRALCRDLGAALDIPASMSFLVRRRVGAFHLEAAHSLEELGDLGEAAVKAPELYLGHLPRYTLPAARAAAFTRGLSTHDPHYDGAAGSLAVYGAEDFLGVGHYEAESASIVPDKVYRIPV